MNINLLLNDLISSNFTTAYRAYDVCHNINNVLKIRSINNPNYDISMPNFKNVYYNEESVCGQKIPFIYGNYDSYINFPNIVSSSSYTICAITKYIGTDVKYQNKILNILNSDNKITSIGHSKWAGVIEYTNKLGTFSKSSDINYNNNWVVTCMSYDSSKPNLTNGNIIIGCKDKPTGVVYSNIADIQNIYGTLNINNSGDISLNSQWGLSHLLVWNTALPLNKLSIVFTAMISYILNPTKDDLILYNNVYPRDLPSCAESFISQKYLNISTPLWAGYFAGNYNKSLNILPEITGNKLRDITSDKIKNVVFDDANNILYGSKNSYIIFPDNSLGPKFTICSITRYTSTNTSNNNMIIQSTNNNDNNLFFHGHYKNRKGVIMYDNFELSKSYPSTQSINSWVVTCAKNTNSSNPTNNVIVNGTNAGLFLEKSYNPVSTALSINYNNAQNNNYNSEWALSYILIWDTHLSDDDLKNVSTALNNYLNTGVQITFTNNTITTTPSTSTTSNTTSTLSTNNSQFYPVLQLTDLQKKMLLL